MPTPRTNDQAGVRLRAAALLGTVAILVAPAAQAAWETHAENPQHTALSTVASQPLQVIRWSMPVDLAPPGGFIFIHYGSPLVTPGNTVIVPVKTGSAGGYRVEARKAVDGAVLWTANTDYILPSHNWIPSYAPTLTASNRLYFAGAGGTLCTATPSTAVDRNRSAVGPSTAWQLHRRAEHLRHDGLRQHTAHRRRRRYDLLRISHQRQRTARAAERHRAHRCERQRSWVSATAASGGDANVTRVPHQAAPALSNDGHTSTSSWRAPHRHESYLVGWTRHPGAEESSPG